MRIAVDLDGTLADIHSVFLSELEKQEGITHRLEDLKSYYFDEAPFSVKKFHRLVKHSWKNREIPLTDSSIPGELDKISEDHRIDIVTARGDVDRKILKNWLEEKNVKFQDFIVDREKTHLEYDILIDSSPKYVGNGMKILLYNRPYNRKTELEDGDRRVRNFSQVRKHVENIAGEK